MGLKNSNKWGFHPFYYLDVERKSDSIQDSISRVYVKHRFSKKVIFLDSQSNKPNKKCQT